MTRYQIWVEGYIVTGQRSGAHLICSSDGVNFADACERAALKGKFHGYGYFDKTKLTLWGCRLFDNEYDARKSFG